ncbi:DUF3558 family protein [Actinopolyspora mortivallis]|uniref:DUF3558 domain-containing protein n=1 Tax=Actinopolyspora mortivallis TaxID=33906 RepID=A0A2T0GTS4_ACTMO|nr:DUF3558 family protein [Actinopolyspora mortivallis]PRW62494.1 hypothetical protein CEP50_15255 [Actinopolyspora mortivallis]
MTRRRLPLSAARRAAPLVALALLTLTACGGGDDSGNPPPSSESVSATEGTSPPRTPSPSVSETESPTSSTGAEPSSTRLTLPPSRKPISESAPPNSHSLADVDPCRLLTEGQRTEVGLPRVSPDGDGKQRGCEFSPPEGDGPSTNASLTVHENSGLDEFTGITGSAEETTVAGHPARIQCEYGNCLIGIAVTENSRVDVQSTVLGDDAATEELGRRIARMVIGNLSAV